MFRVLIKCFLTLSVRDVQLHVFAAMIICSTKYYVQVIYSNNKNKSNFTTIELKK